MHKYVMMTQEIAVHVPQSYSVLLGELVRDIL